MRKPTLLIAAAALALAACTTTHLASLRELGPEMAGKRIDIAYQGEQTTLKIARIEDGVLYAEDGRRFTIAGIDAMATYDTDPLKTSFGTIGVLSAGILLLLLTAV